MTTYRCPKCGYESEQPLDGITITHACPKAKPYKKHVQLKEKKK